MVRPSLAMLSAATLAWMAYACSTSGSSSKKADPATTGTDTGSSTDTSGANSTQTQPCTAITPTTPATSTDTGSATASSTGTGTSSSGLTDLALLAPAFADIQTSVISDCVKCHKTGANQGAPSDYTTQGGWDADAQTIAVRLTAGTMPPAGSPQPSPADKSSMLAYLTGLATAAAGGTTPAAQPCPPVTPITQTSSPVSTSTATSTGAGVPPDSSFFGTFFNPPELAACHSQGLVYNRTSKKCDSAKWNSTCDNNSILTAYGPANAVAVQAFLDKHKASDNWIVDQCGIDNGVTPVAFFVCIQQTGTTACLSQQNANFPSLTLQVDCIGKKPGSQCTQAAP